MTTPNPSPARHLSKTLALQDALSSTRTASRRLVIDTSHVNPGVAARMRMTRAILDADVTSRLATIISRRGTK